MSKRKLPKAKYGGTVFFEYLIPFRLKDSEVRDMDFIIKSFKKLYKEQFNGIYSNRSHFIRCAIIKQIRADKEELKWNRK